MVSIDSWRASSTKAQVLTTTRSAVRGAVGRDQAVGGAARPVSLSESTWFLGQPEVSSQNDDVIGRQGYRPGRLRPQTTPRRLTDGSVRHM